jgi:hypothetical protein
VRLAAVRRWYGPSGCVRRLRRLLGEESAVRMLVGGGRVLIPRASALLQRWESRFRTRGIFGPVLEGPQAEYQ